MDALEPFLGVLDSLGTLGLLIWLVLQSRRDLAQERQAHEETRQKYWQDLRDMIGVVKLGLNTKTG